MMMETCKDSSIPNEQRLSSFMFEYTIPFQQDDILVKRKDIRTLVQSKD